MHTSFRRLLPRPLAPVAAVAGLALVLSGCGGSPTSRRSIAAATVESGAGFTPEEITVDKDDNVVLTVTNQTSKTHGFSIEGYGIQREVEVGEPLEVKFKSTKPGTFRIYCQLHETHQPAVLVVQ